MCYARYREGLSGLVLVQNGENAGLKKEDSRQIPERGIEPRAAAHPTTNKYERQKCYPYTIPEVLQLF